LASLLVNAWRCNVIRFAVLIVHHVLCRLSVAFSIYSETTWRSASSYCLVVFFSQLPQAIADKTVGRAGSWTAPWN
jgi:hypothetical protein